MYDPTKPTPYFKKTGAKRTYPRKRVPIKRVRLPRTRISTAIEKKYLDTSIQNTSDISAGVILNSLVLVPQGTTDVTRIGNKITVTNINLRGFAANDDLTTALTGGGYLRVILYVDKQANGATAAVTDILKSAVIHSFRNMDQVDRFIILQDKFYNIPIKTTDALHTSIETTMWSMNIKCKYPVHFSSTMGAITELRSNNIGLLYISDTPTLNAANVGTARVKFIDL